jgi:hypothetical protein
MPDVAKLYMYIFGVIIVLAIGAGVFRSVRRTGQKNNIESIELGMSEEEMLDIMSGYKYNKSLLKNNRVKYEFRFNNSSSYSYRGYRTYQGVRKVAIYCKDGIVEEVRPYNV